MLTKAMYQKYLREKAIRKYSYQHYDEETQTKELTKHVNLDGDVALALGIDLDRNPDYRDYTTILYNEENGDSILTSKELYDILPELSLKKYEK